MYKSKEHPWIRNADQARDVSLGENVRMRIKQFSLMNKFKKRVLRVSSLNPFFLLLFMSFVLS